MLLVHAVTMVICKENITLCPNYAMFICISKIIIVAIRMVQQHNFPESAGTSRADVK